MTDMKKLYRSKKNKVIAGVSAGVAQYLGIDPVVVRLLMIFLFVMTGFVPLIVIYLCAIVLVPEEADYDIAS